jgi:hypothetical protein
MPLTIIDFIEQVDGVSTEDIPFDEREQINDALADLTGGPGGIGAPVNDDAILVSKNLNGREGFGSIQDAVDSGGAGTGDTIFVEPGEYEPVNIDVGGLRLEGPNAGIAGDSDERGAEATIAAPGNEEAIQVTSGGSGLTLDGFTVEQDAGEDRAVNVQKDTSDVTFRNNEFVGTGGGGATVIVQLGHENVTVKDNGFTANSGTVEKHLFLGGQASYGGTDAASATSAANADTVVNNEFNSFSDTAVESEGQHAAIRKNTFTGAAGETQTAIAVPGPVGQGNSVNIDGDNYTVTGNNFGAEIDTDVLVGPTVNGEVTSENGVVQNAPNGQAVIDGQLGTFDTVQAAVDAAGADATVFVGPGTFTEEVDVGKDVSIEGEGNTTVINGSVALDADRAELSDILVDSEIGDVFPNPAASNNAINVAGSNVNISDVKVNLTVKADSFTEGLAIEVFGTDASATVADTTITGTANSPNGATVASVGVSADNGATVTVRDSDIDVAGSFSFAVVAREGAVATVKRNELSAGGTADNLNGVGFGIEGSTDATAQTVKNNTFDNIDSIEHKSDSGTLDVSNNSFTDGVNDVEFLTFGGGEIIYPGGSTASTPS